MKPKIIPKQEIVPSFDPNAVAVKYIEYYSSREVYNEEEITPKIISKILKEVSKGININLFLDPDGNKNGCIWVASGFMKMTRRTNTIFHTIQITLPLLRRQ